MSIDAKLTNITVNIFPHCILTIKNVATNIGQ